MYRSALICLGCLLLVSVAFAHGNEEHVMGTVAKISNSTITVETTAGKTVELAVTAKTTFEKLGAPATFHDLAVGDRVVIHAGKAQNKLEAVTVKFASAPAPASSSHARNQK